MVKEFISKEIRIVCGQDYDHIKNYNFYSPNIGNANERDDTKLCFYNYHSFAFNVTGKEQEQDYKDLAKEIKIVPIITVLKLNVEIKVVCSEYNFVLD